MISPQDMKTLYYMKIFGENSQTLGSKMFDSVNNHSQSTSDSEETESTSGQGYEKSAHYHQNGCLSSDFFLSSIHQNTLIKSQNENIRDMVALIQTFSGSRDYQRYLEAGQLNVPTLLRQIEPYLIELMCSNYGNYFIQLLFQKLNLTQRLYVFSLIREKFIEICMDPSGTHSIQALIDSIKTQGEERILEELLMNHLFDLFCHKDGQHVIQKIIINFSEMKRKYINNFVLGNADKLCLNKYGSLCLIKFIMLAKSQRMKEAIVKILDSDSMRSLLISTESGASVLLFAIKHFGLERFEKLFKEIKEIKSLIYYATLNECSVKFLASVFQMINLANRSFFLAYLLNLFNVNNSFVKTLLGIEIGEKLLFSLLQLSPPILVDNFIKYYGNLQKGKVFCRNLVKLHRTLNNKDLSLLSPFNNYAF